MVVVMDKKNQSREKGYIFLGGKWFAPKLFGGKFSLKKMILFVNSMDPSENSI